MIGVLFALAVAAQSPPPGFSADGNADDQNDATCVRAAALAFKGEPADMKAALASMHMFYVGRLSGRATRTSWRATASKEADKLVRPPTLAPVLSRCLERMRAILDAP